MAQNRTMLEPKPMCDLQKEIIRHFWNKYDLHVWRESIKTKKYRNRKRKFNRYRHTSSGTISLSLTSEVKKIKFNYLK